MDNKEVKGTNRCPNCGVSDVTYNIEKKKLICNYCHTEFDSQDIEGIKEAKDLNEDVRGSGTQDIHENTNEIVTLKCDGCGAEVVINTSETTNARCHWCRSILSANSQVKNGSIPDVILPFSLTKEEAKKKINEFVNKRKFYANPQFKREFTTNNIIGVYFPYMLVDANCHGVFSGEAGRLIRTYKKIDTDTSTERTVYDIDIYEISREFDISIDDLSIESSMDKLNKKDRSKTTNVINSIMPFDTENCVKFQPNYLIGYNSERRDVNVSDLEKKVESELKDVARHSLNSDLSFYNSGVKWREEQLDIKGKQWLSAYLPVWLYSYRDKKNILHYVAVNGRTGETMGSVPMNRARLTSITALIFLVFLALAYFLNVSKGVSYLLLIAGFLISIIYSSTNNSKYRNRGARHKYESETKRELTNLVKKDKKVRTREGNLTRNIGSNSTTVKGEYVEIKK